MLSSFPHELSGGQKQRALIALSLILEPEVLVMDEPTAALDLLMQRSILNLLYDIRDKYDLTLVFISHDLPIVSGFADRLAVLYAFEFVEVGEANEILGDASHPYTRALLKSTPNLEISLEEMRPIEGESPDPVSHPRGVRITLAVRSATIAVRWTTPSSARSVPATKSAVTTGSGRTKRSRSRSEVTIDDVP